jgi:hypothetical protein
MLGLCARSASKRTAVNRKSKREANKMLLSVVVVVVDRRLSAVDCRLSAVALKRSKYYNGKTV